MQLLLHILSWWGAKHPSSPLPFFSRLSNSEGCDRLSVKSRDYKILAYRDVSSDVYSTQLTSTGFSTRLASQKFMVINHMVN